MQQMFANSAAVAVCQLQVLSLSFIRLAWQNVLSKLLQQWNGIIQGRYIQIAFYSCSYSADWRGKSGELGTALGYRPGRQVTCM